MKPLFFPFQRATLLIPSGPPQDPDRKHLFVLLTSASSQGEVAIVCIRTVYKDAYHDASCIVDVGDHSFVKHQSWVDYSKSEIVSAKSLQDKVKDGDFISQGMLDNAVFERIMSGLRATRRVPRKITKFVDAAVAPQKEVTSLFEPAKTSTS